MLHSHVLGSPKTRLQVSQRQRDGKNAFCSCFSSSVYPTWNSYHQPRASHTQALAPSKEAAPCSLTLRVTGLDTRHRPIHNSSATKRSLLQKLNHSSLFIAQSILWSTRRDVFTLHYQSPEATLKQSGTQWWSWEAAAMSCLGTSGCSSPPSPGTTL